MKTIPHQLVYFRRYYDGESPSFFPYICFFDFLSSASAEITSILGSLKDIAFA
jgi:hypothetical protein